MKGCRRECENGCVVERSDDEEIMIFFQSLPKHRVNTR